MGNKVLKKVTLKKLYKSANIQGDFRELTKSKRLLNPEEIHYMKASWMQNVTEICQV